MNSNWWRGKRVFLTGHTGFKGSWLSLWLQNAGAEVHGYSTPPPTEPNLFTMGRIAKGLASHTVADVRDADALKAAMHAATPEVVLHMAAQPLVRRSYAAPVETYSVNVLGTVHLLEAARECRNLRVLVNVTTDKCYDNKEHVWGYREDEAMGGLDPYSSSKACSELITAAYRASYFKSGGTAVATARAGNVIGGGDWASDRLIPDAVRAWQAGRVLAIRNPSAIRPWQHVLEPLAAYLRLAERLWDTPALAGAYNFGPDTADAASVGDVVALARQTYGTGEWESLADPKAPHEAGWLALEVAKARVALDVRARWPLQEGIRRTMHWYRRCADGADARSLCDADIADFEGAR